MQRKVWFQIRHFRPKQKQKPRKKTKKQKTGDYGKLIDGLLMIVMLGVGYLVNLIHADMQRRIVAPVDSWFFARETNEYLWLFFGVSLFFMIVIALDRDTEKFPTKLFLGITAPLFLILSTFYCYATDSGFYYHRFLVGRFVPWSQVKQVDIGITSRKSSAHLLYRIITARNQKINANTGITFGDLKLLDAVLSSEDVKFRIDDKNSHLAHRLSDTGTQVWERHHLKSAAD